jgi:hypothetical protein
MFLPLFLPPLIHAKTVPFPTHSIPPSIYLLTACRYQIFLEVVGLERGPLSLVSTIEELLKKKEAAAV